MDGAQPAETTSGGHPQYLVQYLHQDDISGQQPTAYAHPGAPSPGGIQYIPIHPAALQGGNHASSAAPPPHLIWQAPPLPTGAGVGVDHPGGNAFSGAPTGQTQYQYLPQGSSTAVPRGRTPGSSGRKNPERRHRERKPRSRSSSPSYRRDSRDRRDRRSRSRDRSRSRSRSRDRSRSHDRRRDRRRSRSTSRDRRRRRDSRDRRRQSRSPRRHGDRSDRKSDTRSDRHDRNTVKKLPPPASSTEVRQHARRSSPGKDDRRHPCLRVFGRCGAWDCQFKNYPYNTCLAYVRGNCRFTADKCVEPHDVDLNDPRYKGTDVSKKLHPCIRMFGSCDKGPGCPYKYFPYSTCLRYLKLGCKYSGDRCVDSHDVDKNDPRYQNPLANPGTLDENAAEAVAGEALANTAGLSPPIVPTHTVDTTIRVEVKLQSEFATGAFATPTLATADGDAVPPVATSAATNTRVASGATIDEATAIIEEPTPARYDDQKQEDAPSLEGEHPTAAAAATGTTTTGRKPLPEGTLHAHRLAKSCVFYAFPIAEELSQLRESPEFANVPLKTDLVRVFVGQLPYIVGVDLLRWLCFTFGGGARVHAIEAITKVGSARKPTGCFHAYVAADEVDRLVVGLDKKVLVDATGVWISTFSGKVTDEMVPLHPIDDHNASEEDKVGVDMLNALREYSFAMKEDRALRFSGFPWGVVVAQMATSSYDPAVAQRSGRGFAGSRPGHGRAVNNGNGRQNQNSNISGGKRSDRSPTRRGGGRPHKRTRYD